MSAGIDYGLGQTNIDLETGIRFGVIHQGEILQAWADSSEAVYPEPESEDEDADEDAEPLGFVYRDAEYFMHQSPDNPDVWVERSPYYTLARYCSPCAPGAGYLMSQDEDGIRAYCPGPDFFEGEPPIAIYRVSDSVRVS